MQGTNWWMLKAEGIEDEIKKDMLNLGLDLLRSRCSSWCRSYRYWYWSSSRCRYHNCYCWFILYIRCRWYYRHTHRTRCVWSWYSLRCESQSCWSSRSLTWRSKLWSWEHPGTLEKHQRAIGHLFSLVCWGWNSCWLSKELCWDGCSVPKNSK